MVGEDTRPPVAGARRVWLGFLLVGFGVLTSLAGVVVVAVANWPAGGPVWPDPDPWLRWLAVATALVWVVWAVLQRSRSWPRRVVASTVLLAGSLMAAALVARAAPIPDQWTGLDVSYPLTVLGLGCAGLGALAGLLGNSPRLVGPPGRRRWLPGAGRWSATVAVAALVAALVAPLSMVLVPRWTLAANTEATTTARPAPPPDPPTLDGTVRWVARLRSGGPDGVVSTAGGVTEVGERQLVTRDPGSGRVRWSFRRSDLRRSHDATPVTSGDGRWLAVGFEPAHRRALAVNDRRDHRRVLVFDAVSGVLRADLPVRWRDATPRFVDDRGVVLARRDDGPADSERRDELIAVDDRGGVVWRRELAAGCAPVRVVPADPDLLVLTSCGPATAGSAGGTGVELLRVARADGQVRWRLPIGLDDRPPADGSGAGQVSLHPSVLVVDERVLLDVRVLRPGDESPHTVSHHLSAVAFADGSQLWRRPLRRSDGPPPDHPVVTVGPLARAGDRVAYVEVGRSGRGEATRAPVRLVTVDPATGETGTTRVLADAGPGRAVSAHLVLPDGRLVLAHRTDGPGDEHCALTVWDVAAEEVVDRLHPDPLADIDRQWCRRYEVELIPVPGGVTVSLTDPGLTPDQLLVLG